MRLKPLPLRPPARWTPALAALPALSIHQPFAWLIAHGIKDVENRSRRTTRRDLILIHAGLSQADLVEEVAEECETLSGCRIPPDTEFDIGGIVGVARIVDCVRRHSSPWKHGPSWGWVLADARPLPFRPCKGALGLFYPAW